MFDRNGNTSDLVTTTDTAPPRRKPGRPSNAEIAARRALAETQAIRANSPGLEDKPGDEPEDEPGDEIDAELEAELDAEDSAVEIEGSNPGITGIGAVSNDAALIIGEPFTVHLEIRGTADLLFHRYSADEVEAKAKAAKGSRAKKTDDIESYVYRNSYGEICLPGRYLQRALQEAGRFQQDPRSPRKSALDLCKAGLVVTPQLAPMIPNGKYEPSKDWDYLDRQRVVVQRSAVTRVRPAYVEGWTVRMEIISLLPEYLTPQFVRKLADDAGRFIGLADFRPTYGRFVIDHWEVRAV